MTDVVDKSTRSRMMAGIGGKNTTPELLLRRELHALGFRYRVHNSALPGKPDLAFARYRAVIQVNGCFWHRHNCHLFKWPGTRRSFWEKKLNDTAERDARNLAELEKLGWRVLTVWECALKGRTRRQLPEVIHTAAHWIQFGEESAELQGRNSIN